jgi:hypothetical protein
MHQNVTIAKPSLFVNVLLWRVINQIGNPTIIQIAEENKNPFKSFPPYPNEIRIGKIIEQPNIVSRAPSILSSILNLMRKRVF